jgi:myo-inositol-1(or 4)-monophosphatase
MELLSIAERAAWKAAEYIRAAGPRAVGPSERLTVREKGHHDWVTDVDREAERLIAETLLAATPSAHLLAEEGSPDLTAPGLVWVVDPLDGTANFLHGYPQYAVSIAAAWNGGLEAGVVVDVTRECCYGAVRGKGAWCAGARLQVSDIRQPGRALLGTGFPFKQLDRLDEYLVQFRRLLPLTSGIRRAGAAALDLADVALGRLDGFWELSLAPWDIAAGQLLVREAGGRVTDLGGRDIGVEHTAVVAGNPAIHEWLLRELSGSGIGARRQR